MSNKVSREPGNIVYPSPIVLVTTRSAGGIPNVAAMAKVLNLSIKDPVLVGVCIRSSTYTHHLIQEQKEFVLNFPSSNLIDKVVDSGSCSGRDVGDKIAHIGLTAVAAARVKPPLLAECPVSVECRLWETHPAGDHDLIIGEVLAEHIDESHLDAQDEPDTAKIDPLILLHGSFWRIGERVVSYKGY